MKIEKVILKYYGKNIQPDDHINLDCIYTSISLKRGFLSLKNRNTIKISMQIIFIIFFNYFNRFNLVKFFYFNFNL